MFLVRKNTLALKTPDGDIKMEENPNALHIKNCLLH